MCALCQEPVPLPATRNGDNGIHRFRIYNQHLRDMHFHDLRVKNAGDNQLAAQWCPGCRQWPTYRDHSRVCLFLRDLPPYVCESSTCILFQSQNGTWVEIGRSHIANQNDIPLPPPTLSINLPPPATHAGPVTIEYPAPPPIPIPDTDSTQAGRFRRISVRPPPAPSDLAANAIIPIPDSPVPPASGMQPTPISRQLAGTPRVRNRPHRSAAHPFPLPRTRNNNGKRIASQAASHAPANKRRSADPLRPLPLTAPRVDPSDLPCDNYETSLPAAPCALPADVPSQGNPDSPSPMPLLTPLQPLAALLWVPDAIPHGTASHPQHTPVPPSTSAQAACFDPLPASPNAVLTHSSDVLMASSPAPPTPGSAMSVAATATHTFYELTPLISTHERRTLIPLALQVVQSLERGEPDCENKAQQYLTSHWKKLDQQQAEDEQNPIHQTFKRAKRPRQQGSRKKHKDPHITVQYRINRGRAFRALVGADSTGRPAAPTVAAHFFPHDPPPTSIAPLQPMLTQRTPVENIDNWSMSDMQAVLSSLKKKAPGTDRVDNTEIKQNTSVLPVLLALCNFVLRTGRLPHEWQRSRTIFLGKPGAVPDGVTAARYRPICLQNTSYKLFSTLLCKSITPYIDSIISPHQKGFRGGFDGCHIQNFLLRTFMAEAALPSKGEMHDGTPLFLALLDIRNAYGSIPHNLLLELMSRAGIPSNVTACISSVYHSHVCECETSPAAERSVRIGLLQGDPISPALSNLYFDTMPQNLPRGEGARHASGICIPYLGFADDTLLLHNSVQGLQKLLDSVSTSASALGLHFNPSKCHVLATHRGITYDTRTSFNIQGHTIYHSSQADVYKYLGVPYDSTIQSLAPAALTNKIKEQLTSILVSQLFPWQKLDAIRTFIQSQLTFALRETPLSAQALTRLNQTLKDAVRSTISCHSYPNDIIHRPVKMGGTGVWDLCMLYHISSLLGGLYLLNCACVHTRTIARFDAIARHRLHTNIPDSDLTPLKSRSGNQWTRVKQALLYFHRMSVPCFLQFPEGEDERITDREIVLSFANVVRDSSAPGLQHTLLCEIHERAALVYAQGPTGRRLAEFMACESAQRVLNNPIGLSREGWQLAWTSRFFMNSSDRSTAPCACGSTTKRTAVHAHSIQCAPRQASVLARHNAIARIIMMTIREYSRAEVRWDKCLPLAAGVEPDTTDCIQRQRPDLVITDSTKGTAIVLDVAISNNCEEAYTFKTVKYTEFANRLRQTTKLCTRVGAVIISPWGCIHPKSTEDLHALGLPPQVFKVMMNKLVETTLNLSALIESGDASTLASDTQTASQWDRVTRLNTAAVTAASALPAPTPAPQQQRPAARQPTRPALRTHPPPTPRTPSLPVPAPHSPVPAAVDRFISRARYHTTPPQPRQSAALQSLKDKWAHLTQELASLKAQIAQRSHHHPPHL